MVPYTLTHLHLRPHGLEHAPEDLHAQLKHLIDRADGVTRKTQAEILLGGLKEGCHLERRVGWDGYEGIGEEVGMGFEDRQNKVEGEEFAPHRMRTEIPLAVRHQYETSRKGSDGPLRD